MANSFIAVAILVFLAASYVPSVTPSVVAAVPLSTAANYVILAKTGITTTGVTAVTGNLGVSPAASTTMTGWGLILSADGTYSTSSLVTGKVYAASYKSPTPSTLTTAVNDMGTAYTNAAGRTSPDLLNYGAGNVAAHTFNQGLYSWSTGLTLGGTITLNGTFTSVLIFQVAGTLNFNSNCIVVLTGGVLASNVFWQSAGTVTLAAGSQVQGTILAKTGIVFNAGAKLVKGRALAQTAVTLISNTLTSP